MSEAIFEDFVLPLFLCVVLPITIVLIVSRLKMNRDNKRAEIIIKALESNADVNADKLIESLNQSQRSERGDVQNRRLLRGCIFSLLGLVAIIAGVVFAFNGEPVSKALLLGGGFLAIGASYMIVYFVSRTNVPQSGESAE
ncbi:MAG: hypothetical protein HDS01_04755 [Bacteroides sp.]|nr:hypothetical protein [Bacteroides sp.]